MCTTSSSRGKRPITAWRARPALGLLLAGAALLALPAAVPAQQPGQEEGGGCVRVTNHEALVEGPSLRVRGEVTNTCGYVVRNVRVLVEAQDKGGQSLGKGEAFVDPPIIGMQAAGRFDVPIPTQVEPAVVNITATFRRGHGY